MFIYGEFELVKVHIIQSNNELSFPEKPRVPPPVKPYSGSKQQSSLAMPPQAAPRNIGSRPKSSYELDQSQGLVLSSSENKSKTG